MRQPDSQQAVMTSRRIIPCSRVGSTGDLTGNPIPGMENAAQPGVELFREDGRIVAVEVRCSCGEQIRLVCKYDE
ncbi:MAG: hypothetical protein WBF93_12085 [Pirellulales bacterium]